MTTRGPNSWHQKAATGVVLLGVAMSFAFAQGGARFAALSGVLLAGLTCAFALWMKGWAVRKGLDAAMLTIGATFGVRLFTAGAGVAVCGVAFAQAPAFVFGFFGAFFPLQVIEILFVLAAHKAATTLRGAA
ncbi:MAG: hypothetical protein ACJ790_14070 [Myxococcaceae bacterium]